MKCPYCGATATTEVKQLSFGLEPGNWRWYLCVRPRFAEGSKACGSSWTA